MPLTSGTKLGPSEIQARLGAGGMGEVYRASDARLDRTVSSLNHPHICHLYDVGSQDGTDFLVMEFIDDRLRWNVRTNNAAGTHDLAAPRTKTVTPGQKTHTFSHHTAKFPRRTSHSNHPTTR
ncbi:MAG TPA: hypothetical protein VIX37_22880 [Candidatus Sulfotelmatobacter sp.]